MDDRPNADVTKGLLGSLTADRIVKFAVVGSFLLLSAGFLYLARDFLLPVSVAFLLALVLSPVVRWLARRGVPAPASALALVIVLLVGFTALGFMLIGPVSAIVADAPRITYEIQENFRYSAVRSRPSAGPLQTLKNSSARTMPAPKR